METGIHRNIPFSQYQEVDRVNYSSLVEIDRSALHYLWKKDNPKETTAAQALGHAFHAKLLEPASFYAQFAVKPECDRRTKEGKLIYNAFLQKRGAREEITLEDVERVTCMVEAAERHPLGLTPMWEVLENTLDNELSVMWDHDETGVACKSRFDHYSKKNRVILDFKTTQDASPQSFPKEIIYQNYYRQGAFYYEAALSLSLPVAKVILVAVESNPPYGVCSYELSSDALQYGQHQNSLSLWSYKNAEGTNTWNGYPTGLQEVGIPSWMRKQIDYMGDGIPLLEHNETLLIENN